MELANLIVYSLTRHFNKNIALKKWKHFRIIIYSAYFYVIMYSRVPYCNEYNIRRHKHSTQRNVERICMDFKEYRNSNHKKVDFMTRIIFQSHTQNRDNDVDFLKTVKNGQDTVRYYAITITIVEVIKNKIRFHTAMYDFTVQYRLLQYIVQSYDTRYNEKILIFFL